ncbi:hypothetical protein ARTHROSP310_35320 [Arthrobacter sp. AD-310]
MKIALGQLESGIDIPANLAAIDRFAAEAARDGAALVAFPEYATYEKKKVDATFPAVAEPLDGPSAGSSPPSPAATASRWWRAWKHRTSRAGSPGAGQVTGRRRRADPAGLLVLGAGGAQDGAVVGFERGTGDREQRLRGGGVPGAAGVSGPERAGGPDGDD